MKIFRNILPALLMVIAIARPSLAQPVSVDDRLTAIERDIAAIKQVVAVPESKPVEEAPVPQGTAVRCDSVAEIRRAVAGGAKRIVTKGIVLTDALDLGGATLELNDGVASWQADVEMQGFAALSNGTLLTHNAKSIVITGSTSSVTIKDVTFAAGGNYSIHLLGGRAAIEGCSATTMAGYWLYASPGTHADIRRCSIVGGSGKEALIRWDNATYTIEDTLVDASQYGDKLIALRGGSPGSIDAPGGIARRCKFVGVFGPNPLNGNDGGQMIGIDRWRIDGEWIVMLPYTRQAEAVRIAQAAFLAGKTPREIARLTWGVWASCTPEERKAIASRPNGLTDRDVELTIAERAKQLDDVSTFMVEDCTIVGQIPLNAREAGTIRRTTINPGPALPVFAGNSQPGYPWPANLSIVQGEAGDTPRITFDACELKGSAIGVDLKTFAGLTFVRSTFNGGSIAR